MRRFAALVLLAVSAPAVASPASDLDRIITDHWDGFAAANPVFASINGDRRFDDRLPDISLAARDREAARAQSLIDRLNAIPDTVLSTADRTNKGVLLRLLRDQVTDNGFGQRMMLFSTYDGWHQSFASMADMLPFFKRADYESYLTRLKAYPALNQEAMRITRAAIKQGQVQPCAALNGFEDTIMGLFPGMPEESRFFAPFKNARPSDMSETDWVAMQAEAAVVIATVLKPEYQAFSDVYLREYKPKCRTSIAASALPQGAAWYVHQARLHTTTDMTPDAIHALGLAEVARIAARMDEAAKAAGFPSRAAYSAHLRADPASYATTPDGLMQVTARIAKQIDGMMPRYFSTLARLPYGLKEIPKETAATTTTAYYMPGVANGGIAGQYFVNTSKLDQRPLWEMPALTAHESVPGHHHQISLQQELEMPRFRKLIAGFTAFVEGWGLYSEYLGEEMGLYDTPAKKMGRLSYEMWRANRLVVDTGMHAKGWSKAQAVAYMRENTALSDANIEAEVNRYISWPGQALGYKIGEIKIRALRTRAEKALGPQFDLRAFHDAVLTQGAVPLDVLDRQIDAWIKAQAG